MKIVVTGGAGFMGSNMIHYLLRSYADVAVVNFDALTYAGNLSNLQDVADDPRYTFVKGDIAVYDDVARVFSSGADLLINYAAETHVDRSILDSDAFVRTNVMGVYTLLKAVRQFEIPRFIQISTDEVYGEVMKGEVNERAPFAPRSPYAASKAAGDHLCHAAAVTFGTPVIVTHSVNFYGPYQFPEKLIPLCISNLFDGKKVPVYGDGSQVREWIFTEDHCRAIDMIAQKGRAGESYNIGTGVRLPNLDVIHRLLHLTGRDESLIEFVLDRAGHDRRYALDHEKLRKEFGWEPKVSFDDGLNQTVQWYRAHPEWVAACQI